MNDPKFWGSYFRSTSGGGNTDRFSKLTKSKKVFDNENINKESGKKRGKKGTFNSVFSDERYKKIFLKRKSKPDHNPKTLLYDKILRYKNKMCSIVKETLSSKKEFRKERINAYHRNDYPCVMVKIDDFEKISKNFYEIAKAYLVAITNKMATDQHVPVELVIRSSFGHNLPSVTITGHSLRINIGIIPEVYAEILGNSIFELGEIIENLKTAKIDDGPFKKINEKIKNYNDKKYKKSSKSDDFKEIQEWKSPVLFDIFNEKGDSGGKKNVLAQIFRNNEYVELLVDYIMIEIEKNEISFKQPLIKLLNSLNYDTDKVKLAVALSDYQYRIKKKKFQEGDENPKISVDKCFWELLGEIFKTISEDKSFLYKNKLNGLYAELESINLKFIQNSQEKYPGENSIGSDSEGEGSFENSEGPYHSKKIILSTGMRAINVAAYIAFYYFRCTKKVKIEKKDVDFSCMYYETSESIDFITTEFFEVLCPNYSANLDGSIKAKILFFDLNHCDTKCINESTLSDKLSKLIEECEEVVCVLDFTSATTQKIKNSVEKLFEKKVNLVILVNSSLKNEQMGADMNTYGTLRIICRKKTICNEMYELAVQALKQNKNPEELPDEVHQLRKAYERCGLSVTSASIFDKFNTTAPETASNTIPREDFMEFIASTENNLPWSKLGFKWNNIIGFLKTDRKKFVSINVQDIFTWFEDQEDNIEISEITELNLDQLSKLSKILSKNEKFDFEKFNEWYSLDEILSWDEDKIDTFLSINLESLDDDHNISLPDLEDRYNEDKDITKAILNYENSSYNYVSTNLEDAFKYCEEKLNQRNCSDDENAYENESRFDTIKRILNDFNNEEYENNNSSEESSSDDL
jgi:hypothetical protein